MLLQALPQDQTPLDGVIKYSTAAGDSGANQEEHSEMPQPKWTQTSTVSPNMLWQNHKNITFNFKKEEN